MKSALSRCAGLAVIAAACIVATGCSKSPAPAAPPQAENQTQQGPAWRLVYQSSCGVEGSANSANDEASARCVARHGLTVSANKTWQAGPAPQGQVKSGALADDDFAKVDAALNDLATRSPLGAMASGCGSDEANAESAATGLHLVLEYHGAKTELCTAEGAQATPARLIAAMQEIAAKYYPVPFPDACADAADAVHALYTGLQSCSTDADCAYINTGYDVVARGSAEYVLTDDCTMVRPMVVGNAASVKASQDRLLQVLSQAQMTCGARIVRTSCSALEGFDASSAAAPICRENVCHIPGSR